MTEPVLWLDALSWLAAGEKSFQGAAELKWASKPADSH